MAHKGDSTRCSDSGESSPQPGQQQPKLVLWGPVEKWGTLHPGVQPNFHNPAVRLLQVTANPLSAKPLPMRVQGSPVVRPLQVQPQHSVQPLQVEKNPLVQPLLEQNPALKSLPVHQKDIMQASQGQQNPVIRSLLQQNSVVQPSQIRNHPLIEPSQVQHHSSVQSLTVHHQNPAQLLPGPNHPAVQHPLMERQNDLTSSLLQTQNNASVNLLPSVDNLSHSSWHSSAMQPLMMNCADQSGQNQPSQQFGHVVKPESETLEHCACDCTSSVKPFTMHLQQFLVPKVEPGTSSSCQSVRAVQDGTACNPVTVEDGPIGSPVTVESGPFNSLITEEDGPLNSLIEEGEPLNSSITAEGGPLCGPITVEDADIVDLWRIIGVTKGFSTDADLAKFLLSVYVHFGDPDTPSSSSSSAEHSTQTDGQCSQCSRLLKLVCVNTACQRSPLQSMQSPSSLQGQTSSTQSQRAYKRPRPSGLSSSPTRIGDSCEDEVANEEDCTRISDHSDLEEEGDLRDSKVHQKFPKRLHCPPSQLRMSNFNKGIVPMVKLQYLFPAVKLHRCDSPSFLPDCRSVLKHQTTADLVFTSKMQTESLKQATCCNLRKTNIRPSSRTHSAKSTVKSAMKIGFPTTLSGVCARKIHKIS